MRGKMYFRHGVMGSNKTLNLLAIAHNYESLGHRIVTIKPNIDDRFGDECIASRAGLSRKADIVLDRYDVPCYKEESIRAILVDEAQFLTPKQVELLRDKTLEGIDVICYGLRTDFNGFLFDGSKRLLELADEIEEVKTICAICGCGASFNLLLGTHPKSNIHIGDEMYKAVCYSCFKGYT